MLGAERHRGEGPCRRRRHRAPRHARRAPSRSSAARPARPWISAWTRMVIAGMVTWTRARGIVARWPTPSDRRRITIAGAGPGGICTAVKLKQAGIEDFVMLEKSHRPGGTWARNRYPGLSCDVPSLLYTFAFEPKVDWSRPFAPQPRSSSTWRTSSTRTTSRRTSATGPRSARRAGTTRTLPGASRRARAGRRRRTSSSPAWACSTSCEWPDIAGLDDFAGVTVHSGAWPEAGLDLRGKAVAVIGSAASAVQMIPEIRLSRAPGRLPAHAELGVPEGRHALHAGGDRRARARSLDRRPDARRGLSTTSSGCSRTPTTS